MLAAFSLGAAGALPIGFGITALILELVRDASRIGRPGAALLAALGLAGAARRRGRGPGRRRAS